MCGLAGFVNTKCDQNAEEMEHIVLSMAEALAHRGPDDAGAWCDPQAGVALGHRRLSIIDLSPLGHQPMVSSNDRYVIAYNGEVYNFQELRSELQQGGVSFRGNSDTEVILEAWSAWGGKDAIEKLIGMFSFAVWDRETRSLSLVRDRYGIKPMFWGKCGDVVYFGSQLGAFKRHPNWNPGVNREAVVSFMRHGYVPAPRSIYQGIEKLEPGTMVTMHQDGSIEKTKYWDLQAIAEDRFRYTAPLNDDDATNALEELLMDAVGKRMVADVPLGTFLSGGVDSSLVAALMQAQSARPIKTFTIGFAEKGYDESQYALAVARHLGTEHTEQFVEPCDALEVLPDMASYYDEPFADSSQIPTFLLSRLTRKHVTVALSGDGGDELFAGYNRYFIGARAWQQFRHFPKFIRSAASQALLMLPPSVWSKVMGLVFKSNQPAQLGERVYKFAQILPMDNQEELYRFLVSQWLDPESLVVNAKEPQGILWDNSLRHKFPDFVERMQVLDSLTYLPDDILTKVDRASMAVSLEARVPLLDHRVAEFSWKTPIHQKIRGGQGKWLLRQVLYRHVPRELIERPKMGFGVPIGIWLRNELFEWADSLLSKERLESEGFLNPGLVRTLWDEHQSEHRNHQYIIWNLLIFQSWLEKWVK